MTSASDLLAALDILELHGTPGMVTDICYDSRRVGPGSLYVARVGAAADGHLFIPAAIAAGASVIVCEHFPTDMQLHLDKVCFVSVAQPRLALAQLSQRYYNYPARDLKMIGVTGTNGKTTCTFILRQLLEACGESVAVIGTTGVYFGSRFEESANTTPEAPELCALLERMRSEKITTVVMEVSSHALSLDRVAGIEFRTAIFTNLSQDHLDFHESMDDYLQAKKKLFSGLTVDSLAIVNADDPAAQSMLEDCKAESYGLSRDSQRSASWCQLRLLDNEQSSFADSTFRLEQQDWHSPLVGSFNVDNVALCLLALLHSGYDASTLAATLPTIHAAPGRMQQVRLRNGAIAIIDYAHSPDALEKTLRALRQTASEARILCVFGAGGDRDRAKRPLMGAVAEELSDVLIVTNDNPRTEAPQQIVSDILSGMHDPSKCLVETDRAAAIARALELSTPGDCVLIAGKGHENYQIIGRERLHFSDLEEVLKADSQR